MRKLNNIIPMLTREELIALFKFDITEAKEEFSDYVRMNKHCPNPPPCLKCNLQTWAYCAAPEYCCAKFIAYLNDPKAEKGTADA